MVAVIALKLLTMLTPGPGAVCAADVEGVAVFADAAVVGRAVVVAAVVATGAAEDGATEADAATVFAALRNGAMRHWDTSALSVNLLLDLDGVMLMT